MCIFGCWLKLGWGTEKRANLIIEKQKMLGKNTALLLSASSFPASPVACVFYWPLPWPMPLHLACARMLCSLLWPLEWPLFLDVWPLHLPLHVAHIFALALGLALGVVGVGGWFTSTRSTALGTMVTSSPLVAANFKWKPHRKHKPTWKLVISSDGSAHHQWTFPLKSFDCILAMVALLLSLMETHHFWYYDQRNPVKNDFGNCGWLDGNPLLFFFFRQLRALIVPEAPIVVPW